MFLDYKNSVGIFTVAFLHDKTLASYTYDDISYLREILAHIMV
jgi:hypothetical protein